MDGRDTNILLIGVVLTSVAVGVFALVRITMLDADPSLPTDTRAQRKNMVLLAVVAAAFVTGSVIVVVVRFFRELGAAAAAS